MLILILIDAQYLQNVAFSFEKVELSKSLLLKSPPPHKKFRPSKISHSPTGVTFTLLLNAIWKTLQNK